MSKLTYFKLELKRNLKLIPYLIVGAIALSLITGVIAFCAGKLMYYKKVNDKKTIVFASGDDSTVVNIVVNSLSNSESLTSLYNIKSAGVKEAIEMAERDEAILSVIVPEGFMHDISVGKMNPITLYFSSNYSIRSVIITELSLAVGRTLKAADSGVYVAYDYYTANNAQEAERKANNDLDADYLSKALFREGFFNKTKLMATGSFDLQTYYISSGIMLIILLLGCIFILRTKNTAGIIPLKLCQNGVGIIAQSLINIFCIFLTLYIVLEIGITAFSLVNIFTGFKVHLALYPTIVNGAVLCLSCAGIISFSAAFMPGRLSAVLFLFIITIASAFISGAFIPSVFLPGAFDKLARFLPTTYLLNTTGMIIKGDIAKRNMIMLLYCCTIFSLLTIICNCYFIYFTKYFDRRTE